MEYVAILIVLVASGCNSSLFVVYSSHSEITTVVVNSTHYIKWMKMVWKMQSMLFQSLMHTVMDSRLCAYSRNEEKAMTMYCRVCLKK